MTDINRREFIKRNAFAVGSLALGQTTLKKAFAKNDTIHMGVIGTGRHGRWTMRVLKSLSNLKMVACCDIIPEHLEMGLEIAGKGAVGYKDYRKLLENKDVDAVLIATPLSMHYQMSVDALSSDKHVYCEKTMTYNIDQAIKLVEKAKASKKIFQVGYQMRLNPLYKKIKEMLDVDYLGTLTHIYCNYNRNADWRRQVKKPEYERIINWRMYREYSVGLMAELCSHHIDLVNMILDSHPTKACGFGGIDYWKDGRETYDNVHALYTYPRGIKAEFSSLTTNAFLAEKLKFLGTEGTIVIGSNQEHKAIYYPEGILSEKLIDEGE
ncbi:MAG: Gfo/Idh/MocA family oxidoreductase, partial [candidate division KSB1 bacterium]|nr:Gfo/Idh/MocA family oxidoreductase [candidate division KSB1 bacterium]